jgi:Pvc16 N-terminal domain
MYTALRATSQTLAAYIRQCLEADPNLAPFFTSGVGGNMVVSLNTPQEMTQTPPQQGVSVWLYRVIRDEQRLNAPPERLGPNQLRYPPLPLCLHYLVTPVIDNNGNGAGPELEQTVLGKVLQIFHDHPRLRGTDLRDDFSGATVELHVRLEPLTLEEITRIWEGLHSSYQLSVSYEVSVVNIASAMEPESVSPVQVVLPEYGVIVSSVSP